MRRQRLRLVAEAEDKNPVSGVREMAEKRNFVFKDTVADLVLLFLLSLSTQVRSVEPIILEDTIWEFGMNSFSQRFSIFICI